VNALKSVFEKGVAAKTTGKIRYFYYFYRCASKKN